MRKLFILVFLFFFFCERKVKTIKEVVFPEGPLIVESVLCTKVVNGRPYGITNEFFAGDTINLWILWMGMKGEHKISCFWVRPDGRDFAKDSVTVNPDSNKIITVFSVVTESYDSTGEWAVEIYLDKKFYESHLFYLNPSP